MIIKGASCAMHLVRLFTYPTIRMMRETDEYSGEGIYMNIDVTDDTEDERRPTDE